MIGRHRENLPAVRIHHNDADIFRARGIHEVLDVSLDTLLHLDINRAHDGVAVLRLPGHILRLPVGVHIAVPLAVRAGEHLVIGLLYARRADPLIVVTPVEAEHIARELAVRILALVVFLQVDGAETPAVALPLLLAEALVGLVLRPLLRLIAVGIVHMLLKIQEAELIGCRQRLSDFQILARRILFNLLSKLILIHTEKVRERMHGTVVIEIAAVFLEQRLGRHNQLVALFGRRQIGAVPVHNLAAAIGDHFRLPQFLAPRERARDLGVALLHAVHPIREAAQRKHREPHEEPDLAPQLPLDVVVRCLIYQTWSLLEFLHTASHSPVPPDRSI